MRRWIPFSALILLILSLSSVAALTTDGLTLLALRSAVSSDPTRVLTTWYDSDPTPCYWPGVSCSPRGLVTGLSLPGRSLSGYLPSELSLLASLQTLDLSNNRLAGRVPAEIGNLTALSRLDLSSNSFNGSLPTSIAALPNLAGVLNLSFNSFSGEIPPEYGRIPVAVSLDLRDNDLSGEIPQVGSLLNQGPTAFARNPNLCGFPLKVPCGGGGGKPNPHLGTGSDPDVLEPRSGSQVLQPVGPSKRRAAPAVTATILAGIIFAALVSVIVLQWQFRKKHGSGEGKRKSKEKGKDGEVTVVDERREGKTGEFKILLCVFLPKKKWNFELSLGIFGVLLN